MLLDGHSPIPNILRESTCRNISQTQFEPDQQSDKYAQDGKLLVYLPDFMDGQNAPFWLLEVLPKMLDTSSLVSWSMHLKSSAKYSADVDSRQVSILPEQESMLNNRLTTTDLGILHRVCMESHHL